MWRARLDWVRGAPAPVRATLMIGIALMRDLGLAGDIDPLPASSHVSHPMQPIATALMRIVWQMAPKEIAHVARAGYGRDVARHRKALQMLPDDPALAFPEGEVWYPAEVIELVPHGPGKPGQVPRLAIVLLDALRSGDAKGYAEFRLDTQHEDIVALAPALRSPMFAAFRHPYESDPHWSPSVPEPFTLPWVSLT